MSSPKKNAPISKGRMIRKSISKSDSFASLSKEAQVLFCLLIPHFNSHGKQEGGIGYIKSIVCPKISYLTYDNLSTVLNEISTKTDVKWYRAKDGLEYLQSTKWEKHQDLRSSRLGSDLLPNYSRSSPRVRQPEVEVEVEVKEEVKVMKLNQNSKDMIFQNLGKDEKTEDLIARILEEGFSKEYEPYWRKAIKQIGPGLVDECLGDVRSRVACGEPITNKSAYFTTLLKQQMNPPNGKE